MVFFIKKDIEGIIKKHKSDFSPDENLKEDTVYSKLIVWYNIEGKRDDSELQLEIIANELEENEPITVVEMFLRQLLNKTMTEETRNGILNGSIPLTRKHLKLNVLASYKSGVDYYFEVEKPLLIYEAESYGIDITRVKIQNLEKLTKRLSAPIIHMNDHIKTLTNEDGSYKQISRHDTEVKKSLLLDYRKARRACIKAGLSVDAYDQKIERSIADFTIIELKSD